MISALFLPGVAQAVVHEAPRAALEIGRIQHP